MSVDPSLLLWMGAAVQVLGIAFTVRDLRAQQKRLAQHQPPAPAIGPPDDPLKDLVVDTPVGYSEPWHDDDPNEMYLNLKAMLEAERTDRLKADRTVIGYTEKRLLLAIKDADRRRQLGDDRLREVVGSASNLEVVRGPLLVGIGLLLSTWGSVQAL